MIRYHFFIIGCGGTGGNFVRDFARFLYAREKEAGTVLKITLVDGDTVEERNIARQPFSVEDIGKNKAQALCEAVYEVFGLSFEFCTEYLEDSNKLKQLCMNGYLPIIIGAVDNHAARIVMHEFFDSCHSCIYFDSANEFSCGELAVGARLNGYTLFPDRAWYFRNILKETFKKRSEMGCEELNQVAPQHIVTNVFAANLLLMNVAQLLTQKKLNGGLYLFDAFKGWSSFTSYKKYLHNMGKAVDADA